MPYAVTLRLDAAAAAPIETMWRALAAAGLHDDSLALGYPPHVTLTVHPDTADPARLHGSVEACAARWSAIDVTLAGFGIFAAPMPVLYLAPVVTGALLASQRALADALSDQPISPHHRPGAWVPHVTLAQGGAAGDPGWMGRALDLLAPLWPALRPARAERLELVQFRPVKVLASHPLPRGLAPTAASV